MAEPSNVVSIRVTSPTPPGASSTGVTVLSNFLDGWTDVRITRGAERLPNDFTLTTTEKYPAIRAANIVQPYDQVQLFIGDDCVLTGYVDSVTSSLSNGTHSVSISGRGKCQDLVDCSAEWSGGQINGTNALDISTKLAQVYGISTNLDPNSSAGPDVLHFPLNYGESAFDIIDRVCRAAGLLTYEDVNGNLYLSNVGTIECASDFQQAVNIQSASSTFSGNERFAIYQGVALSVDTYTDIGEGGFLTGQSLDSKVPRHRLKYIVAETIGGQIAIDFVQKRLDFEMNRRNGRSRSVSFETDSWRDVSGALYAPNTLAHVSIPILKIDSSLEPTNAKWVLGEVTYESHLGSGTTCHITMMPPTAYAVLPKPLIVPPPDVKGVPPTPPPSTRGPP